MFEFPVKLLSSFTRRYCLSESDGVLIMVEYLKFITIFNLYGDGFSPSSWVDEFWHHHMNFDTRHYREFWQNVLRKWTEHNEIDFKNLTNSEQSQLMMEDSKFRKAYLECFGHKPIECIWPEMISEGIEEPHIFVNIDIMKMLITKKTVKEANIYALKNQLLFKLEEYKYNKRKIVNIIPNFFSKFIGSKTSKSVKEYQEEIDLQIKVLNIIYLIAM